MRECCSSTMRAEACCERHVGGEREDLAAGRHDLADGDVVELDGAVDDLFLKDGEQAHAAGGGGDEF